MFRSRECGREGYRKVGSVKFAVFLIAVSAFVYDAQVAGERRRVKRESTEWCDVWMPNATSSGLPRVLLIGDSIARGYFGGVEERLKGKAYCARFSTSKAIGDPALPIELSTFLGEETFDVIHFNFGLHGFDYSESEYQHYLPEVLGAIRTAAPAAKLIWASTTPVRTDHPPGPTNARIQARNAIAKEFFTTRGIPFDDLWALMEPHPEMHSDDLHFNREGTRLLAERVAAEIEKVLSTAGRGPRPPALPDRFARPR